VRACRAGGNEGWLDLRERVQTVAAEMVTVNHRENRAISNQSQTLTDL
jgi:hypothetical protein